MNLPRRIAAFTLEPPNPLAGLLTGILLDSGQSEMESTQALSMNLDEIKQYLTSDEIKELFKTLDSIENYKLEKKKLQEEIDRVKKLLEELGKVRKLTGSSLSWEQQQQMKTWIDNLESQNRHLRPLERAADEAHESVERLLGLVQARKKKAETEAEVTKRKAELREIALKELNPPYEDARKYLDEKDHKDFLEAIPHAIDEHIHKRTYFLYEFLCDKIKDKKQEEQRKLQARFEAEQYLRELNNNIANFKASLFPEKKNVDSYFNKDISYCTLQLPQGKAQVCRDVVEKEIQAGIPENLRSNLIFKLLRVFYRSFPHAEYLLIDKVPCLNFSVWLYMVAEIEYQAKQSQICFGYSIFDVPNVKDTGLLGYGYKLFTPHDLNAAGYYFWQTIPCILIQGLLQGEMGPQGTKITEVSEGSISYKINDFDDEITVPETFSKYLKEIGSWQGLVQKGVISSKVGEVVTRAMERSTKELSSPETPKLSKDTKKARAFLLFNEGKRPGDPKVKSLGIKPQTAYRYYQDWKKIQHSSQNPT